ncbi:hypothetical protein F5Y10DRAFT_233665 [Nemania abortiva]|nr:hypothetical protein F5Y10DRAFT_233665 [Nemania abortiva]
MPRPKLSLRCKHIYTCSSPADLYPSFSFEASNQKTSVKMKYTVAIFALFTVAMGQFVKVARQDSTVQVQGAAMSAKNGDVVPFSTDGVYKAATDAGL